MTNLLLTICALAVLICDVMSSCPRNCRCLPGNEVECSSSGFVQIPVGIPYDTERLFLDGNMIPVVYAEDFRLLTNLKFLTLANSRLNEIQDGSFAALSQLEELNLNMNALRMIRPRTLDGLTSLRILRIDQNQALRVAPCTLSLIPQIESIGADHTRITFDESLFLNRSICESPDRYRNESSVYSEADFVPMVALKTLRLERADASRINRRVMKLMPRLGTLNLQNTAIQTIEDSMFRHNRYLTTLLLAENLIREVGNATFVGLKKLQVLVLTANHGLRIHPNTFLATRKLKTLYLDGIGLESLSINFFSFQQLTNLIISDNELTYISPGTLSGVGSIRICLGYNPWHCDCNLVGLYEWLRQFSLGNLLNCVSPVCRTPVNIAGAPLLSLNRDAFQCINDTITEGPDRETSTPIYPRFAPWLPNLTPTTDDRGETWVLYTGGPRLGQTWTPTTSYESQGYARTRPGGEVGLQPIHGPTHEPTNRNAKTPEFKTGENNTIKSGVVLSNGNGNAITDKPSSGTTHHRRTDIPATGYRDDGGNDHDDEDDGIKIIVLCTEFGIICLVTLAILWMVLALRRVNINRRNRLRGAEHGLNMDTVSPLWYFQRT